MSKSSLKRVIGSPFRASEVQCMEPQLRRTRGLLLLALLCAALTAPPGAGAHLIKNGSFERGLSGWTAVGSSLRLVHSGKSGQRSVRVAPRRSAPRLFLLSRSRPLGQSAPNRVYRVSAWLRGRQARVCLAVRELVGKEIVGSGERCLRVGRHWRKGTLTYRALDHGRLQLLVYSHRRTRRARFFVDGVSLSRPSWSRSLLRKPRPSAPASTATPMVSGDTLPGSTLSGTNGAWVGTTPISYSYQWRRCNALGQTCSGIWGAVAPVYTIAAADQGSTLRLVVTARNAYGSGTATSAVTGQVQEPASPLPPPPPPTNTRPDAGVNFHCGWSDYTDQQRAQVLDRLQAAGVKWVRIDMGWSSFQEIARGQLSQWYVNVIDRCVDLARARGINVLGMLFRTPAWANGGKRVMVPPLDMADFAWIAHWAADHFRGRVAAWEIWNEPDPTQATWSWSGTVGQYVQLLKAAYPAIKSADPSATVVFGGPSWNDTNFISSAYAAGAKGSFDVMAVHPYQAYANAAPEQVGDTKTWWFARAGAVHDVMVQNGDGDKKLWFTEFGWSSHPNTSGLANWQLGVTDAQQGDYLVRAIEYARLHFPYVTNMFWYNERNQVGTDQQNANYGLLNYDLTPKPAYSALQAYLVG